MRRDKRLISLPTRNHLLGTVLTACAPLGLPIHLASSMYDAGRPRLPAVSVHWDRLAHRGPLLALLDASACIGGEILVLAADLPRLRTEFLLSLLQKAEENPSALALVPEQGGRWQPLCALYREPIWPELERSAREGNDSLVAALRQLEPARLEIWPCEDEPGLRSWNRPEDRAADLAGLEEVQPR